MKISQKQAHLLAKEVLKQLKTKSGGEVPQHTIDAIKQYREKKKKLLAACSIHDEALAKHKGTFKNIVGRENSDNIYDSDSMEKVVEKLKRRSEPRLSDIEDEIVLGAMFASDDDLQSFVNKIVKKFEKKTRNKVLSN